MRKIAAAILAVPVIAITYLQVGGRSRPGRVAGLSAAVLLAAAVAMPSLVAGTPPRAPQAADVQFLAAATDAVGIGAVAGEPVAPWTTSLARLYAEPELRSPQATAQVPSVVRFRPRADTTGVAATVAVSVRFTMPMDRPSTEAAFGVTVAGKTIAGTMDWAEDGTVLIMTPTSPFPSGAKVVLTVAPSARSTTGVPLAEAVSSEFTVAVTKTASTITKISHPLIGTFHDVELYYLKLLNCTRTGGWVTSSGSCLHPNSNSTKPLVLLASLSDNVARPYARLLVSKNICSHYVDGNLTTRLAAGGWSGHYGAENLGCRNMSNLYASVLGSHLYFQSEKSYNGGHWVNMMNPLYDHVGIGVAASNGIVRLVVDFLKV